MGFQVAKWPMCVNRSMNTMLSRSCPDSLPSSWDSRSRSSSLIFTWKTHLIFLYHHNLMPRITHTSQSRPAGWDSRSWPTLLFAAWRTFHTFWHHSTWQHNKQTCPAPSMPLIPDMWQLPNSSGFSSFMMSWKHDPIKTAASLQKSFMYLIVNLRSNNVSQHLTAGVLFLKVNLSMV